MTPRLLTKKCETKALCAVSSGMLQHGQALRAMTEDTP